MPIPVLTLWHHNLMPPFQLELSLSWNYKNWLPTQEKHWLSLEPAHCSYSVPSTLPGLSGGRPTVLKVPTLSPFFAFNKLTPFWVTLCLEILFHYQPLVTRGYLPHSLPIALLSYKGLLFTLLELTCYPHSPRSLRKIPSELEMCLNSLCDIFWKLTVFANYFKYIYGFRFFLFISHLKWILLL